MLVSLTLAIMNAAKVLLLSKTKARHVGAKIPLGFCRLLNFSHPATTLASLHEYELHTHKCSRNPREPALMLLLPLRLPESVYQVGGQTPSDYTKMFFSTYFGG